MTSNQITGIFVLIFGLLAYFVLIPYGIKVPKNIELVSTSPAFWPSIIAVVIAIMGGVLIIPDKSNSVADEDVVIGTPWSTRLPRLLVVGVLLFGFYFVIDRLGMVVPSMVLIFTLMVFSGYRRWGLMVLFSLLVPIILYVFFVYVANIPIPLGIFESLRG